MQQFYGMKPMVNGAYSKLPTIDSPMGFSFLEAPKFRGPAPMSSRNKGERSKYMPRQGEQEKARRVRQMAKAGRAMP